MKSKRFSEQVEKKLLLTSDVEWGGLPFFHSVCPSVPFVRRGASPVSTLMLTTAGYSEVSWSDTRKDLRGVWDIGTLTHLDRDYELENLSANGEQTVMAIELNERLIENWTGEDLSAGALRGMYLPRHIVDADHHLLALMHGIGSEIRNGCQSGRLYAESVSLAIVTYFWGRFARGHSTRQLNGLSVAKLRAVKDYIKENLQNDVTLVQLAGVAGLSPKHLGVCFKQATGETPYQYLLNARVQEAKRRLRSTDPSITEVALSVGFSTPGHFSTAFRKITGLSPSQFRNRI